MAEPKSKNKKVKVDEKTAKILGASLKDVFGANAEPVSEQKKEQVSGKEESVGLFAFLKKFTNS